MPEYSKFQFCFLKVSRIFFLMFLIYGLLNPWERKYRDMKGWCISIGKKKFSRKVSVSLIIPSALYLHLYFWIWLTCTYSCVIDHICISLAKHLWSNQILSTEPSTASIQSCSVFNIASLGPLTSCFAGVFFVAVVVVCLFCFVLLYCNSHVL